MLREWSDIYSIGIADIDAQHQKFFAAAHRLYDDILEREGKNAVEDAMTFMRNYAEEHFQTEVDFMRKHDYPGLKEHLMLHAGFFRKLDELENDLMMFGPSQALADRALDITQDWLIEHIADEDMLYSLHVKAKGVTDLRAV